MKLALKIVFSVIGGLLLLTIATVVVIGINIYDETDNSSAEIVSSEKVIGEVLSDYMTEALSKSTTEHEVALVMSEEETNYLLNAIRKEISIPFLNIKAMYAIYNDNSTVTFEAPFSFFGFRSVLKGDADLTLSREGTLMLSLNEISIGKLKSTDFLVKFFLGFINTEDISKALAENGIHMDMTLSEGKLTAKMDKDNLIETVESIAGESGKLFGAILGISLGNSELFEIKFNDDDVIGAVLHLNDLKCNESIPFDLETGTENMTIVKEKIVSLIRLGTVNYENVSLVADFLVRGYDALDDEAKDKIDKMDFSSIGITHARFYDGIVERSALTMAKIFLEAAVPDAGLVTIIARGYYDITISESSFNELLNSLPFIGTSFAFSSSDKCAAITISSMFAEFRDDELSLKLIADINGENCICEVSAIRQDNKDAVLELRITSMNLGRIEVSKADRTKLLEYLEGVLGADYLKIDAEGQVLTLDFTEYLNSSFFGTVISNGLNKQSVHLSSENGGKLIVRLSKN
ncbi:MAG: hypothetical protein J6X29_01345 [Clostridia bacterium]|nr:hypothetical protein [Clostridia bacterium]